MTTWSKKRCRPPEVAQAAVQATRRRSLKRSGAIPVERLIVLDESGVHVAMSRSHTWVKRGTELIDPVSMNSGKTLTLLGAIGPQVRATDDWPMI